MSNGLEALLQAAQFIEQQEKIQSSPTSNDQHQDQQQQQQYHRQIPLAYEASANALLSAQSVNHSNININNNNNNHHINHNNTNNNNNISINTTRNSNGRHQQQHQQQQQQHQHQPHHQYHHVSSSAPAAGATFHHTNGLTITATSAAAAAIAASTIGNNVSAANNAAAAGGGSQLVTATNNQHYPQPHPHAHAHHHRRNGGVGGNTDFEFTGNGINGVTIVTNVSSSTSSKSSPSSSSSPTAAGAGAGAAITSSNGRSSEGRMSEDESSSPITTPTLNTTTTTSPVVVSSHNKNPAFLLFAASTSLNASENKTLEHEHEHQQQSHQQQRQKFIKKQQQQHKHQQQQHELHYRQQQQQQQHQQHNENNIKKLKSFTLVDINNGGAVDGGDMNSVVATKQMLLNGGIRIASPAAAAHQHDPQHSFASKLLATSSPSSSATSSPLSPSVSSPASASASAFSLLHGPVVSRYKTGLPLTPPPNSCRKLSESQSSRIRSYSLSSHKFTANQLLLHNGASNSSNSNGSTSHMMVDDMPPQHHSLSMSMSNGIAIGGNGSSSNHSPPPRSGSIGSHYLQMQQQQQGSQGSSLHHLTAFGSTGRQRTISSNSNGAGSREVHNILEKNRRAHLKECYDLLKDVLPSKDDERSKKTSNLAVLNEALMTVKSLQDQEKIDESKIEQLAKEKITFKKRIVNLKRELGPKWEQFSIMFPDSEFGSIPSEGDNVQESPSLSSGRGSTLYSSSSSLSSGGSSNIMFSPVGAGQLQTATPTAISPVITKISNSNNSSNSVVATIAAATTTTSANNITANIHNSNNNNNHSSISITDSPNGLPLALAATTITRGSPTPSTPSPSPSSSSGISSSSSLISSSPPMSGVISSSGGRSVTVNIPFQTSNGGGVVGSTIGTTSAAATIIATSPSAGGGGGGGGGQSHAVKANNVHVVASTAANNHSHNINGINHSNKNSNNNNNNNSNIMNGYRRKTSLSYGDDLKSNFAAANNKISDYEDVIQQPAAKFIKVYNGLVTTTTTAAAAPNSTTLSIGGKHTTSAAITTAAAAAAAAATLSRNATTAVASLQLSQVVGGGSLVVSPTYIKSATTTTASTVTPLTNGTTIRTQKILMNGHINNNNNNNNSAAKSILFNGNANIINNNQLKPTTNEFGRLPGGAELNILPSNHIQNNTSNTTKTAVNCGGSSIKLNASTTIASASAAALSSASTVAGGTATTAFYHANGKLTLVNGSAAATVGVGVGGNNGLIIKETNGIVGGTNSALTPIIVSTTTNGNSSNVGSNIINGTSASFAQLLAASSVSSAAGQAQNFITTKTLTTNDRLSSNKEIKNILAMAGDGESASIPDILVDKKTGIAYKRERFFGKGGFANVYQLIETKTNAIYAGKIISKKIMLKNNQRDKMVQEIAIHRAIQHPNIVKFYDFFDDQKYMYIIMELCKNRSMSELLKRRRCITEYECRYYMLQIIDGVKYLHDNRIIHRDLKLGNLLLDKFLHVKIGDFGLATRIDCDGERKMTLCGTPNYIAPEILSKKGHSYEVDIWSIGCIMYTLLVGQPPFETRTLKETYAKIRKCDYNVPTYLRKVAADMIIAMLRPKPEQRPKIGDLLKFEFLTASHIPKFLPMSCLTMVPRPHTESGGMTTRNALKERNQQLQQQPTTSKATGKDVEMKMDTRLDMSFLQENLQDSIKVPVHFRPDDDYKFDLSELCVQLRNLITSKPKILEEDLEIEKSDPEAQPLFWISKWVDYSDKYGFGYSLCNDSMGVMFNDSTTMILLPNQMDLHYIDSEGHETYMTTSNFCLSLQKKVKLLSYFRQYMSEHLFKTGAENVLESDRLSRMPHLHAWFRTRSGVCMSLTNGTLQMNFSDHIKVMFCPRMRALTCIDSARNFRTYRFSTIIENGCSRDLYQKVRYAYEKIVKMLEQLKGENKVN